MQLGSTSELPNANNRTVIPATAQMGDILLFPELRIPEHSVRRGTMFSKFTTTFQVAFESDVWGEWTVFFPSTLKSPTLVQEDIFSFRIFWIGQVFSKGPG